MSDAAAKPAKTRSTRPLWLLAALCIAPVIASYTAYYFWRPEGHVNYGELLEPRAMPDPPLALVDGKPFRLSELRHKWVMVVAHPAQCGDYCQKELVYLRQVRLAQGKDADRIERVVSGAA